jgi:hypothetical protein
MKRHTIAEREAAKREFQRHFANCANFFDWSPSDLEEIKEFTNASVRAGSREMVRYWEDLSIALYAGYLPHKDGTLYSWYARLFGSATPEQIIQAKLHF